jgi:hypothetical protein
VRVTAPQGPANFAPRDSTTRSFNAWSFGSMAPTASTLSRMGGRGILGFFLSGGEGGPAGLIQPYDPNNDPSWNLLCLPPWGVGGGALSAVHVTTWRAALPGRCSQATSLAGCLCEAE